MSNETEREAFEIAYTCAVENGWDNPKELARYIWDQAGAAYQRTQAQPADALVEALNELLHQIDINDFMDSNGHSAKMLKAVHDGMKAVATYRAAQEKPHD